jgi:hypothetical protein
MSGFKNALEITTFAVGMRIDIDPCHPHYEDKWWIVRWVDRCCGWAHITLEEDDTHSSLTLFPQNMTDYAVDLDGIWEGRKYRSRMTQTTCRVLMVSESHVAYESGQCVLGDCVERTKFLAEWEPIPLTESLPEPPVKKGDIVSVEYENSWSAIGTVVRVLPDKKQFMLQQYALMGESVHIVRQKVTRLIKTLSWENVTITRLIPQTAIKENT